MDNFSRVENLEDFFFSQVDLYLPAHYGLGELGN
jgi:hypothetical protein